MLPSLVKYGLDRSIKGHNLQKGPNLSREMSYLLRKKKKFRFWILKIDFVWLLKEDIVEVQVEDLQQLPLDLELKMYKLMKHNIA